MIARRYALVHGEPDAELARCSDCEPAGDDESGLTAVVDRCAPRRTSSKERQWARDRDAAPCVSARLSDVAKFKHDFRLNQRRFVTMVVDHKSKRLMDVVEGKDGATLEAALFHIPGRENVRFVALDLSDGSRRLTPVRPADPGSKKPGPLLY